MFSILNLNIDLSFAKLVAEIPCIVWWTCLPTLSVSLSWFIWLINIWCTLSVAGSGCEKTINWTYVDLCIDLCLRTTTLYSEVENRLKVVFFKTPLYSLFFCGIEFRKSDNFKEIWNLTLRQRDKRKGESLLVNICFIWYKYSKIHVIINLSYKIDKLSHSDKTGFDVMPLKGKRGKITVSKSKEKL